MGPFHSRLCRRAGAVMLVLAAALLAAPAGASALTACDYASGVLQVDLEGPGDATQLEVAAGGEIVVRGISSAVTCTGVGGPPTVANTNAISVFNHPGSGSNRVTIDGAQRFAPGATQETGGDEIEIFVNLNDRGDSALKVKTDPSGGSLRFGSDGINPNATPDEDTPDVDIFPNSVPVTKGFGSSGPDALGAQGGAGTGSALTAGIQIEAGAGVDSVTGGQGDDVLLGQEGADTLLGMGGDDDLYPGSDNDSVDGGPGTDQATYGEGAASGVSVDLALVGPQSTGGSGSDSLTSVESLVGSEFADALRGDAGGNELDGAAGDDVLVGRGGSDEILGGTGNDTLDVRDGEPDGADCGPDTDTVTTDSPGIDLLNGCENLLFPAITPAPGAGGGNTSGGSGVPATAKPTCAGKTATIVGTPGKDKLVGTKRADVIVGLGGNDTIRPGSGKDIVCGGSGRDGIAAGGGNDRISGGSGSDRLSGDSGNDSLAGNSGNDRLGGGSGRDKLNGGSGKDSLSGGSGLDDLSAGSGADRLNGGAGRDRCKGGSGSDRGTRCERSSSIL